MKATIPEVQALITECNGNVAAIARRLRVSRAYIYKRINEAPTLRNAISDAREAMLDNVESALYKQVLEGNTTAMIFWLKTQGKKRGWVERQEVEVTTIDAVDKAIADLERELALRPSIDARTAEAN